MALLKSKDRVSALASVYFVRHPETAANVGASRVRGNLNVPLDKHGEQEAVQVAQRFKGVPAKIIFSSDLERTLALAALIAQATGGRVIPTPDLRSWDRGVYAGKLEAKVAPYIEWYVQHPEAQIPQGTSLETFLQRLGSFVLQQLTVLEARPELGPFVDVTHAWAFNALPAILTAGREPVIYGSAPAPGSVMRLDWNGSHWKLRGPLFVPQHRDKGAVLKVPEKKPPMLGSRMPGARPPKTPGVQPAPQLGKEGHAFL